MTLEQTIAEALRQVVREEIRAALGSIRPDVLSVHQAADYAEVSPRTVRTWVREGMPATRRGRRVMVRREDVDRWRAGGPPGGPVARVLTSLR